jgi:hypothetical protein
MMVRYIESYAYHGGEGGDINAPIDHILRFWDEAKGKFLYRMFGSKFILEKEIVYQKDNSEMETELQEKFYDNTLPGTQFINKFHDLICTRYYDANPTVYFNLRDMSSCWALIKNVWEGDTFSVPVSEDKEIKVQNGARITRILGKLAAAFELEYFEEFRIMHSMVLNQKELRGNLCLSIHPLDYMTMSDNDCDWESCMSWKNNGCYRQGTVEMMNSPCVVVAYLTAKEPMQLSWKNREETWSNKKWRELFVVDRHAITSVKPYPYFNAVLTDLALDWLRELATAAGVGKYRENVVEWEYDDQRSCDVLKEAGTTFWYETCHMYNDFEADGYQRSYFAEELPEGSIHIHYSGESECMACGSTSIDCYDNEGCLVCDSCEGWTTCDHCDDRIYDSESEYHVDGLTLCCNCYENHTFEDAYDGEIHATENGEERIFLGVQATDRDKLKVRESGFFSAELRAIKEDDVVVYRHYAVSVSEANLDRAIKAWTKSDRIKYCPRRWNSDLLCIPFEDATDDFAQALGFENMEALKEEVTPKNTYAPDAFLVQ